MAREVNPVLPEILSIGLTVWDPVWALTDHASIANELMHIRKGVVRVRIGSRSYSAKPGDTIFVPRGVIHRDEFALGSPFEVLHVQFTVDDRALVPDRRAIEWLAGAPLRQRRRLAAKLSELFEIFAREGDGSAQLARALLYALLLFIREESRGDIAPRRAATSSARHTRAIAMAREYIDSNLAKPITLFDIARHLGMSTYHLSHVFSRESGFSLSTYITDKRMERARGLLEDPRVRISEAAYAVGFNDANYFAKSFRRHTGVSPSQYREANCRAAPAE